MKSQYRFCFMLIFQLLALCDAYSQTPGKNYIISRAYKQAGAGANEINNIDINVQYLDGIGRPIQNVSVGKSRSGKDIIVPISYDGFGRKIQEMLPYSASGNGAFQNSAVSAQATFYTNNGAELDNSDLERPFKRITFENSANGRILNERAPGGNSDSSKVTYGANAANEVKLYNYSAGSITQSNFYAAGRLFKMTSTDENGKVSTEFKDLDGLVICRTQTDGSDQLTTYYVYDELNRLRAVLQPKYQEEASLAKYAFVYAYDNRGRTVSKGIPSQGTTLMVYDNFDRVVLSQDENQKAVGKWAFIKYDLFSRIIMTGEIVSAKTQAQWQTDLNASTAHHEDDFSSTVGYTLSNTLPSVAESNVLVVSYYDDYGFIKPTSLNFNGSVLTTTSIATPKNMKTGSRTKMLTAGANWLVSAIYYDSEYRVIQQTRELDNLGSGAYERVSTKYKHSLAGVVDKEQTDQVVSGSVSNSLLKTFTYDHAERLLSVKEKVTIGTTRLKEAVTVAHRYSELGQLREKWLHSENGGDFRRQVKYADNIRGWQTSSITRYWPADSVDTQYNFYGLQYDYKQVSGKYTNGNISNMKWISEKGTTFSKGLSFTYDGLNRLKGSAGLGSYAETESGITYDKNGNILTLLRAGSVVDNLAYTYSGEGNRVTSITDNSGNNSGFKSGAAQAYTYDSNGNMKTDGNRGATLTYNYLNLPSSVAISGLTAMSYNYDASGVKHQYISTVDTVKYAGPFEYNKVNTVKRITLSEGQAVVRRDTLWFDIYLKDHVGNVRVVLDEKGRTIQKTDYYPFGLEIARDNPTQTQVARNGVNRYNFLGKETQIGTGYIDLSKRFYDPLLGRFLMVDPVTDAQENQSVYQYGWNNPVLRSDPNGDCPGPPCGTPLKLLTNPITVKNLQYATENQKKIGFVKVGFGLGESYGFKVNKLEVKTGVQIGYQELKLGTGSLDYTANGIKLSAHTDVGPVKAEAEVNVFNMNVKALEATGEMSAIDGTVGASVSGKDAGTTSVKSSGEAEWSLSMGPFTIGGGGSFEAIGKTLTGYVQAIAGYAQQLVTEATNNTFNTDTARRTNEQYMREEIPERVR